MTPEMSALKTRLKSTWESGDHGVFASYLEIGALGVLDRLNIAPGTRLLDVGSTQVLAEYTEVIGTRSA
jgi:hypothetical protein